jgi:hypothetical protein
MSSLVQECKNNTVVSSYPDNNIFHIFAFDIIRYYNDKSSNAYIWSENIDENSNVQKWRYFLMKKLYNNCEYVDKIRLEELQKSKPEKFHSSYDCWEFINYKEDPHITKIYSKIISNKIEGKHILLNIREDHRILYENNSGLKLETFLQENKNRLNAPFMYCNFSKMKPEEQYDVCHNARVLVSAHGAGCTNLIFTPINTPVIEINFRKHWYCDNVCDEHFRGEISMNAKCDGKLSFRPYFHKADYHNLCYLLNKKYIEIEAVKYDGGFLSRNPISKKNIYIDGENLIQYIDKLLIEQNK